MAVDDPGGPRRVTEIFTYLVDRGISFLVLPDPSSAGTEEAARAHGLVPDELVRTEVVIGKHGHALLLVPATRYLDLELARRALGDPDARPATHAELRTFAPGCEIGAIPPLSLYLRAPLYVDPAVADRGQLVFAAGRRRVLICVEREELFRDDPYVVVPLTGGSAEPPSPTPPSRRALLADDSLVPVHLQDDEAGSAERDDPVNDAAEGGRSTGRHVS
jgi:Ala-tRNA(Pro) deacylase